MDAYHWDFQLVWTYKAILIHALGATLELLAATIVGAIPIGVALGLLRLRKERIPRYLAGGIVEFVRALPPLVLLIWIYYCLPVLTGLTLPAFQTLVVALALYTGVFFAEIFRAGLQSVDRGQIDAAYSVGMTGPQVLLRVTAPIAFLRVFPPFVSQCVLTIKNTALGYFVAPQRRDLPADGIPDRGRPVLRGPDPAADVAGRTAGAAGAAPIFRLMPPRRPEIISRRTSRRPWPNGSSRIR
jgi:polar amino acid transport system permease protein